jgi:uncharacterized phage-associated protein
MRQGYSSFKVARFFIEKAAQTGEQLTPMKLIKLVYIAHAWSLVFFKRPLISEDIQAWKYGPVIESLYHGFKRFGNSQIPANEVESLPLNDMDAQTMSLLEKIWSKYGVLSGAHLSSLTHLVDTPWDTVWNKMDGKNKRCATIPDDLIQTFYQKKLDSPSGSGH